MGMLTLLVACNGQPRPNDHDHDGAIDAWDCDDADAHVFPGAPEIVEDGVDQDCDGVDPIAERTYTGAQGDEGYGTRVLVTASGVLVGAPFGGEPGGAADGRVYTGDAPVAEGAGGERLGAALAALADGTVLVGLPGTGGVRTLGGEVLLDLEGAGGVLAARGAAWVTSTATGLVGNQSGRLDWDRRPDALALGPNGGVWAGFARGEPALRTTGQTLTRAAPTDEAGFALLLADVGADGVEDLVVGAPGAGVVYVLDPAALPASLADATPIGPGAGRFGAALAVDARGVLYVGAPMAGSAVEGAVYAVEGREAIERWTGAAPGDQLGFALAAGRGSLAMGAPGEAAGPGSVWIVSP